MIADLRHHLLSVLYFWVDPGWLFPGGFWVAPAVGNGAPRGCRSRAPEHFPHSLLYLRRTRTTSTSGSSSR